MMANFSKKQRIALLILILCNAVIVLAAVLPCFHHEELHIAQEEFLRDIGGGVYEEGFYVDMGYEGERRIATGPLMLRRGFYAVTVALDTNNNGDDDERYQCYAVVSAEGEPVLGFRAGQIESDRVEAYQGREIVNFRVYARFGGEYRVMICVESSYPERYALVHEAHLTYLRGRTVLYTAARVAVRLLIVDLLLLAFLLRKERTVSFFRRHAIAVAGVGTVIFLAYYPYLNSSLIFGGDLWYHMNRIRYLAEGLQSGVFPVRIHPGWDNGYGYAAGVFYGDLLLLPSAVLLLLGYTMNAAYKFHVLQMTVIHAVFSYAAAKRIASSKICALMSSCLYTLSLQRIMLVTPFHMVGQFDACAFLPLIVAALYGIYRKEGKRRDILMLAVGLTGILESHVITTFMTAIACLVFGLFMLRSTLQKKVYVPLLQAAGLTVLLNLFYILPFSDYMLRQPIQGNTISSTLWKWAMEPMDVMARSDNTPLDGKTIGLVPFLVIALGFGLLLAGYFKETTKGVAVLTGCSALFLYAGTKNFPYFWLHYHLPALEEVLRNIQFPDRFFSIVSALCLGLFALSYRVLSENDKTKHAAIAAGGLLCVMCLSQMMDYYKDLNTFGHPIEVYDAEAKLPTGGGSEFMIPGRGGSGSTEAYAEMADAVTLSGFQRNGTTLRVQAKNLTKEEQFVIFPLWAYRNYAAKGGTVRPTVSETDDHRVRVTLPAGFEGELRVWYKEPWYWRLSELISLLTVLCLIYCVATKQTLSGLRACYSGMSAKNSSAQSM